MTSVSNSLGEVCGVEGLAGLRVLYVLAMMLLLAWSRNGEFDTYNVDMKGGAAALPLLFVVFGFESWIKKINELKSVSALGYASMHVARYAPALFVSSIMGMSLDYHSTKTLTGDYLLLPLGFSTWIPSLRVNDANSLVWISGAFVFNSLLFLPLQDAITKLTPSVKTRVAACVLGVHCVASA